MEKRIFQLNDLNLSGNTGYGSFGEPNSVNGGNVVLNGGTVQFYPPRIKVGDVVFQFSNGDEILRSKPDGAWASGGKLIARDLPARVAFTHWFAGCIVAQAARQQGISPEEFEVADLGNICIKPGSGYPGDNFHQAGEDGKIVLVLGETEPKTTLAAFSGKPGTVQPELFYDFLFRWLVLSDALEPDAYVIKEELDP